MRLIPNAGCLKRCQRVSATRPRTIIDRGARLDTRCEFFPERALPIGHADGASETIQSHLQGQASI